MILSLEYHELQSEALESLADLYQGWTKRMDALARDTHEPWGRAWQEYRQGNGNTLADVLPLLPEWQQRHFAKFASLQRFATEIQRAFVQYENEIQEAYRHGLQRGRQEAEPNAQEWRGARTYFDRMKQLERIPQALRLCYTKELLRQRTKETAQQVWPELF